MSYVFGYGLALAGLAAMVWLPGYVLASLLLRDAPLGALRPLAHFTLGLVFWIGALFALASLGGLGGTAVAILCASIALAAGTSLVLRGRPQVSLPFHPTYLLGLLLVPHFLRAASPSVGWDAGTYHLTLPKLFIEAHGFRPVPGSVYATWPLNTELVFALAMILGDYVLANLAHFGFGLLCLLAIYLAGTSEGRDRSFGWLGAGLFLASPVVAVQMHQAYVDLACTFFFVASFLFLHRALEEPAHDAPWLALAGVAAGLLSGSKLTGLVGAAAVGALYLPRLAGGLRAGRDLRPLGRWVLLFVLPVVLLGAPWFLRALWLTGNPAYPLLYASLGGPDWSADLSTRFAAWHRSIGMGRSAVDYALLPVRLILWGGPGYEHFDGRIGVHWLLAIPIACCGVRQRLVRRALVVAGLSFVFWATSSQQMRLLIPVFGLLAIACSVSLAGLAGRRTALGVAVLLVAWSAYASWAGAYRLLERYRNDPAALREQAVPPVFRVIDRDLPPDARLLFVNYNQGFFCERAYLADSFFEASQIADWLRPARSVPELRGLLVDRGITHLLIQDRDWGIDYGNVLGRLIADPRQVETLYRSRDGFALLRLRPEKSGNFPSPGVSVAFPTEDAFHELGAADPNAP